MLATLPTQHLFPISNSGSNNGFTNTGEIRINDPGAFIYSGGPFAHAAGGLLSGTGTFDISGFGVTFTCAGDVRPGLSAGIFKVDDELPLGATSGLNVELGGSPREQMTTNCRSWLGMEQSSSCPR